MSTRSAPSAPSAPPAPSPSATSAAPPTLSPSARPRPAPPGALRPETRPATLVPLRRASVADRVARAFLPIACVRGYQYFVTKRVALGPCTEAAVEAEVRGKRVQHVRLAIDEGRLATACSCSATLLGPAVCRHVWATLLEVDRQGELPRLRATQRGLGLAPLPDGAPARAQPPVDEPPHKSARDRQQAATAAAAAEARTKRGAAAEVRSKRAASAEARTKRGAAAEARPKPAASAEARTKRAASRGRPR